MIVVRDVRTASQWFQDVLSLTTGHGGDEYEMLLDGGELVLQLHRWDAHEHPLLGDPGDPSRGNGILLWFSTDDVDAVAAALRECQEEVYLTPLRVLGLWHDGRPARACALSNSPGLPAGLFTPQALFWGALSVTNKDLTAAVTPCIAYLGPVDPSTQPFNADEVRRTPYTHYTHYTHYAPGTT